MDYQAKETVEFLDFVFDLADATKAAKADDGKVNLKDAPKYFGAAWKAPAAIGGIEAIPKELSEHSPGGKQEVISYLLQRFNLADDELEALYEDTMTVGFQLASVLERWVDRKRTV